MTMQQAIIKMIGDGKQLPEVMRRINVVNILLAKGRRTNGWDRTE